MSPLSEGLREGKGGHWPDVAVTGLGIVSPLGGDVAAHWQGIEAGRCAIDLKQWKEARTYLDRCIREFPRSDEKVLQEARLLLAKVSEGEHR